MLTIEFSPENAEPCRVLGWIHANHGDEIKSKQYPAVVICPGGAYMGLSDREAEPVAEKYYACGYNTFILYYAVGNKAKNFTPLIQLASTIKQIRQNSEVWCTAPNQIAVCGFSAGGHLAASSGTLTQTSEFKAIIGRDNTILPNAMILNYPVITADEFAHVGSIETVSGCNAETDGYKWFGLDKHVSPLTPPTFIWHTAEDSCVPVENSLKMSLALSCNKVPFELHIFPAGEHGMSICTNQVATPSQYNARWIEMSVTWLNKLFDYMQ